jgi:hypothetical protein
MHYYRLILLVGLINLGVFWYHQDRGDWLIDDGSALSALATLTLLNFAAAVVIRQQHVLNVLFGMAGRGSSSWPLWVRWTISKVHHIGGIHVGAALAGTAWLCAFICVATIARLREPAGVSLTTQILAYSLTALALLVVICAAPAVRSRAHNLFEVTHRFGGWTAVAVFWALTVHLALVQRGDASALGALASSWEVWVLALVTACIVSPWLRLRRVPVTVERPSAHAVIVGFDYGVTPAVASAVGISRNPLREWHAFATVTTPGRSGYRLLISRAGDWTGKFIDDPRRTSGCEVSRPRRPWRRWRLSTSGSSTSSRGAASDPASGRSWPLGSQPSWSGPRGTRGRLTAMASSTKWRRRSQMRSFGTPRSSGSPTS